MGVQAWTPQSCLQSEVAGWGRGREGGQAYRVDLKGHFSFSSCPSCCSCLLSFLQVSFPRSVSESPSRAPGAPPSQRDSRVSRTQGVSSHPWLLNPV